MALEKLGEEIQTGLPEVCFGYSGAAGVQVVGTHQALALGRTAFCLQHYFDELVTIEVALALADQFSELVVGGAQEDYEEKVLGERNTTVFVRIHCADYKAVFGVEFELFGGRGVVERGDGVEEVVRCHEKLFAVFYGGKGLEDLLGGSVLTDLVLVDTTDILLVGWVLQKKATAVGQGN